jgi:hypothetical protein
MTIKRKSSSLSVFSPVLAERCSGFREYFFLSLIPFCLEVRFGCIKAFRFLVIFSVLHFVLHILIVNFFRVVSASGCRLVKPNHLNLGVLCDYVLSVLLFSASLGLPKIIVSTNWYQSLGLYFARWLLKN